MMFRNKLKLFTISLTAVWIVLFIKNVDIPVYFRGDSQFVGWARLLTYRNLIALFSVVMMAVSIHSIIQLRRKQSFRAVLCTLIYISIFVPNLNFGQDEHKRRRQVLCLNGSQVPNRVQEQEPSRVL